MSGSHIHKESLIFFCFPERRYRMEIFIDEETIDFDELEVLYNESEND